MELYSKISRPCNRMAGILASYTTRPEWRGHKNTFLLAPYSKLHLQECEEYSIMVFDGLLNIFSRPCVFVVYFLYLFLITAVYPIYFVYLYLDFGLSNTLPHSCLETYEKTGIFSQLLNTHCGSPAYAAPELLAQKNYGPQVDVWSM